MTYLKCKSCGGIYQLKPGKSPDDFERCTCGGELEYFESFEAEKENTGRGSLTIWRFGIFIIAFFIVYMVIGQIFGGILEFMAYFGPGWGAILLPLFIIGGTFLILALIWYGLKK